MDILLPPQNLYLERGNGIKYNKIESKYEICRNHEENRTKKTLILSWDRGSSYYEVHQANESFYDVMWYNYDTLKGYTTYKTMDKIYNDDYITNSHVIWDLTAHTTYYFIIIASTYSTTLVRSEPSEEVSMYIDFNVDKYVDKKDN